MKKIIFLLLAGFLLFSCTKPEMEDPTPSTSLTSTPPKDSTVAVQFTSTVTNVSVYDGTNGKISIQVTAGTSPYKYKIGTGNYRTTSVFDTLKADTYKITVEDSKNQTLSKDITVGQPGMPKLVFTLTTSNVDIYGFKTGTITALVTSGMPPYSYSTGDTTKSTGLFTKLSAGTYNVTVTDNKKQTLTASTTITQPDKQLIYSAVSISTPTTITQYLSTFSGRNRFSIAFQYTSGDHVNSNGVNYNEATLFSISNSNSKNTRNTANVGDFVIKVIQDNGTAKPGIYCKRFMGDTPGDQIWNYSSTIWKGASIVVTYDGTNLKFYLNKVLVGTNGNGDNINGTVSSILNITAPNIYIGTGESNFPAANNDYNGTISNLKIYNEALTQSDVTSL